MKCPTAQVFVSYFNLWILISSFLTSIGGIFLIYASYRITGEGCRYGIVIAAAVLEGLAVILCLIAMGGATWSAGAGARREKKSSMSYFCPCDIMYKTTSTSTLIQTILLVIINFTALAMVIVILTRKNCGIFVYNAIYNIFGIIGAFLIGALQAIELRDLKNPDPRHPRHPHHPRHPRHHRHHHHPHDPHHPRRLHDLRRPHNPRRHRSVIYPKRLAIGGMLQEQMSQRRDQSFNEISKVS